MTVERRFGEDTEFGKWLRAHPRLQSKAFGLSVQNLDYICHWFLGDKLMLIEEKTHGGQSNFAQRDTHKVLDSMLRWVDGLPIRNERGEMRKIAYCGYHVLRFENEGPLDGWIEIDGVRVSEEELVSFLRFEWTPGDNAVEARRDGEKGTESR